MHRPFCRKECRSPVKLEEFPCEIAVIRSSRRTISAEVRPDGTLLVRAPRRLPDREIRRFLHERSAVLRKYLEQQKLLQKKLGALPAFSAEELAQMTADAKRLLPDRVAHFARLLGVTYGRITVRHQKTRWGSCSAAGNLNFNCLLMCVPPEVRDSVIVHELCHRIHLNHSAAFYAEIDRIFPAYARCHAWLKANGAMLIGRLP